MRMFALSHEHSSILTSAMEFLASSLCSVKYLGYWWIVLRESIAMNDQIGKKLHLAHPGTYVLTIQIDSSKVGFCDYMII